MAADHEHRWIEETTIGSPLVDLYCTVCGETRTELKEIPQP